MENSATWKGIGNFDRSTFPPGIGGKTSGKKAPPSPKSAAEPRRDNAFVLVAPPLVRGRVEPEEDRRPRPADGGTPPPRPPRVLPGAPPGAILCHPPPASLCCPAGKNPPGPWETLRCLTAPPAAPGDSPKGKPLGLNGPAGAVSGRWRNCSIPLWCWP